MSYLEKHPMSMIVLGILGISLSAIFVRYSQAPSVVTAAYRMLWTVLLMTPMVLGNRKYCQELTNCSRKTIILCAVSGIFLGLHFVTWFESLALTSVASSTVIVCTEVIWVALGFCIFLRGKLSKKAILSIALTLSGSVLIALSDYSSTGSSLFYGDLLALTAAIMSAFYTLIGRVARSSMTTMVYTYIVYTCCSIALLIATAASGYSLTGYGMSPVYVGLALSVVSTLLGHSIFSWCLKYLSPTFVSASKLCEPVIAAIFAVFLFQEIPVPLQIAGGVIILWGVIWYSRIESSGQ